MNVIKRNGKEVIFDKTKIINAVTKANEDEQNNSKVRLSTDQIKDIADHIENYCDTNLTRAISVEEIQDMVEDQIISKGFYNIAKCYIKYRYKRTLARQANTTDGVILSLVEQDNEEVKQENSNKNPTIISTQRDYVAGEVSRDITNRLLLPDDVVEAHKEGIIHFHDADYFIQKSFNCCLVNLEDMLQNGTVISGTLIEKPHSFATACNIATQIIAQVASNQYGGQSVSLSHLAPFVDISRQKYIKQVRKEFEDNNIEYTDDMINNIAESRLLTEIKQGVQMIQYQVLTLMTTNGQTPFITIFMYIDEVPEGKLRDDLALIIRETIALRLKGIKNEQGAYISPAFPKLIYVLEEDNIYEDSKYWDITVLAAKCTAKRLVPDYISEKIMKQLKVDANGEGHCYPVMGCVQGDEIITYKLDNVLYVESFKRFWNRMSKCGFIRTHGLSEYFDTYGRVMIYDTSSNSFVNCKKLIKNPNMNNWVRIKFSNGRNLVCTNDHPLPVLNRYGQFERTYVKDMCIGDAVPVTYNQYSENSIMFDTDIAWLLGILICDSNYSSSIVISLGIDEMDIINRIRHIMKTKFDSDIVITDMREKNGENYYQVRLNMGCHRKEFTNYLYNIFGGDRKLDRHIPSQVFSWNVIAKYSFLAGLIDADGYCNKKNTSKSVRVQLGSTNKEFALQQMALVQSLGYPCKMYISTYSSHSDNLRYRIEFTVSKELYNFMTSNKKIILSETGDVIGSVLQTESVSRVVSIEPIYLDEFSYDVETESDRFDVSGIISHNCRSALTPYIDENGKPKYYGRFNCGVVTINLPDVALSSGGDMDKFWKIFDERLELCYKALMCRHNRLKGTKSDVSPIHWQYGAIARLKKGETIDKLLYNGYSTLSLGYAGLCECVRYMTGKSHTDEEVGKPFAIKVMQHLNDACAKWKEETTIAFSLYGTPIESTTYKFAKCLQKRFGIIEGVTSKNYITNSYHVHVTEPIDAFSKLKLEAEFQALSPGGAISYVEVPNLQDNIPAVLSVMKYIYDNIMYAELNTKSDYCQVCAYDGEIQIVEDENKKLIWQCPKCGNTDQSKMNVARRVCGYISTNFFNAGRTQEIKERVLHL